MSYDDKAMVSVDADGNVLKCAKGLGMDGCGFVKGAKICAKCGAMPVQMKMIPVDEDMVDEGMVMPMRKKKKRKMGGSMPEEMPGDEEMLEEEMMKTSSKSKMSEMMMADMEEDEDEEEDDTPEEMRLEREEDEAEAEFGEDSPEAEAADRREEMAEEEDPEEEVEETEEEYDRMKRMRDRRLASMGMKSADLGETGYMCAVERKAYPGSAPVCESCPGGCVAEKGMPGLLEIEGIAEELLEGKTIDSGYSAAADIYVVDVETKTGEVFEAIIDGTTAEVMGWHKLDESGFEKSDDDAETKFIDFMQAGEIAVKAFDGSVVAIEPDVFEGIDSYAVEIDGFDGKSYDVFVGLDGEVLGYDLYEPEEASEIEAEAAEIALKREFSDERRMQLAEEGMALPDGSYPIVTEADLRNAIQAFGRAKDKEAAKAHIKKRAREMGKEELIPENWMAKKKADEVDGEFLKALAEFQILEAEIDTI